MDTNKITAIATSMIAFPTFLGVLIATIYYFYQIKELNILEALAVVNIYILLNLLFLYVLKKWRLT
jgi:hypothetical protein